MKHPSELQSGAVAWRQVRLLVFSQDDDFRFLVRSTFRKLSIRDVSSTSVPADGQPLLARGADLVLLDLGTAPDQGFLMLESMRAPDDTRFHQVPVLAVVPSSEKALIDRARSLGIEGVVPKPVSGHELVGRVSDTLKAPERMPPPATPVAKPQPKIVFGPPASVPVEEAKPAPAPVAAPPPPEKAPAAPAPKVFVPPQGKAAPAFAGPAAAPPRPREAPTGGIEAAPRPRPAGGGLSDDDLAVMKPGGGGVLVETAAAPAPVKPAAAAGIETAAPAPVKKAETKKAEAKTAEGESLAAKRRREQWEAELAKLDHKARKGKDVAAFDPSAVVAEHLKWLQSKGAEGKRANLEGMDLAGVDLPSVILANATLRSADLCDARLTESRLDGADFRYAKLSAADLAGANLGVASLRHANLSLANLDNTVLRGADLSGATLRGAKLTGTDFSGATMVSTDLREADLRQVENLTQGQVDKAVCDMSTKLPAGVFPPAKD